MIAVALVATWLGGWPFRALIAVAAALMLVEWADMHGVPRLWAWVGGGLLALLLLAGAEYLYPAAEAPLIVDAVTWAPNWLGFGGVAAARSGAGPGQPARRDGRRIALCRHPGLRAASASAGSGSCSSSGCSSSPGRPISSPISRDGRSAGPSSRRGSAPTRPGPAWSAASIGAALLGWLDRPQLRDGADLPLARRPDGADRAGRRSLSKAG